MRRALKWLGYLMAALAGLAACGVIAVYAVSEYRLSHVYETPPFDSAIPDDAESIAEGQRLAQLRGCYRGCHARLEGQVFFDEPWLARVVAPNLTEAAQRYSPAELAAIIRFGVRPDGTSTTGMPSEMFRYLSNEDLARIIAFLRHAEPVPSDLPETRYRILARLGLALGDFEVDAERALRLRAPESRPAPDDPIEYGHYLAITVCSECHGVRLEGSPGGETPPLTIAKGYSGEDFARLMREGIPLGGRELRLMDDVARIRFSRFSDPELEALYAFLQSAELPLPEGPGQASKQ